MIKRFIYNLFKEDFLKFAFSEQSKPVNFESLDMVFIDSNGKRYYKYLDDLELPIVRKGHVERLVQELHSCMSKADLKMFIDEMDASLGKTDKNGHMKPDIATIGFLIKEMKERENILLHPDVMFELVSAMYIREDENPAKWDEQLQEEKVKQFKKDSKDGLYDFFHTAGLRTYLPYLDISQEQWTQFWEQATIKVEAMKKHLKSSTSEKELSKV